MITANGIDTEVACGPRDHNGNRLVIVTRGQQQHRDCFDTDSAFRREKFLKAAEAKVGFNSSNREYIDNLIIAEADAVDETEQQSREIERFTLGELAQQYPKLNEPVIDGICREGESVNVIASSKVGKSWFVYYLMLCVALGIRWFGRFSTSPGRVLLVDNELHRPTLANRIQTVANAMGLDRADYADKLHVWPLRGRLRSLEELVPEFEQIEPGTFKLIVLDAKYRFAENDTDENSNSDDRRFANTLDKIAEHTKAAFVLIHHSSKGDQSGKRITDVGAGAGAQSRTADCHAILREHEEPNVVVLEAALRSFAPVEPLSLRWEFPLWTADNDLDPAKLKGNRGSQEERQAARDQKGMDQIMESIGTEPNSCREIQRLTGISRERCQRLLDKLTAEDRIQVSIGTIKGNVCDVFSKKI